MKIAFTGSSGHIAQSLIPLLCERGHTVRGLVHKQLPFFELSGFERVNGSLSEIGSLERLVSGCDAVIHCAAEISIRSNRHPRVYDTNVSGTIRLFESAKRARVRRFVHISSIHAYDEAAAGDILTEESPYCSDQAALYDLSKRDSERYLLEHSGTETEVIVLNPTAILGPPDHLPSLMGKAIIDLYKRKVPALIEAGFDFVDVRDVASGIFSALEKGRAGERYLLSGNWHSLGEIRELLVANGAVKGWIPVVPLWAGFAGLPFINLLSMIDGMEPLYTRESLVTLARGHKRISSAKAAAELGYRCRPISETLAETVSWFRDQGRI